MDIDPQLREELGNALSSLVMCAQELGFEIATCTCEKRDSCAVFVKSRELIVALKKLFEIQKKLRS